MVFVESPGQLDFQFPQSIGPDIHDMSVVEFVLCLTNIRTKSYTSASLNALSELLASYLAGVKDPKTNSYFTSRVWKMAVYGFFVSAPLSHYLVLWLQKAFRGKTGLVWKIAQILASNLVVAPISNTVFLVSMAVIAGARTKEQIVGSVKAAFLPVMKASWVTSPIVLALAQAFVPEAAWVPFFSFFAFIVGTYNNVTVKKKRAAALREAEKKDL
jgi:hypothetical protein